MPGTAGPADDKARPSPAPPRSLRTGQWGGRRPGEQAGGKNRKDQHHRVQAPRKAPTQES